MDSARSHVAPITVFAALLFCGDATAFEGSPPGKFDYYVLSISWLPSYCLEDAREMRRPHCSGSSSNRFTLHGLWPEFDKGWPTYCDIGKRPWIEDTLIEEMSDIMPSKSLVIHEYRKHGTCTGLTPEAYYKLSRELFERIEIPPGFVKPQSKRHLSPATIERAFLAANDWLTAPAITVSCRDLALADIRVCFDRALKPRACGVNENQQRACPLRSIAVPAP